MDRPRIVVHQLASVDGRLTIAPDVLLLYGDERWQAAAGTNDDAYQAIKSIHQPQATLEGSASFILPSAQPEPLPPFTGDTAPLYQDYLPQEIVSEAQPSHKWFTVVDSQGRVRWLYKEYPGEEWKGWYPLVLVSRTTPSDYLAYLQDEQIPYLVCGEHKVDLRLAAQKLYSSLQVTCLLSTAGGKLNGALLRAGLVDELSLELFPALIGGQATPSLFDAPPLQSGQLPARLSFISAQIYAEGRVWLRYQVLASGA